jgi:putative ABC transport system permease protein
MHYVLAILWHERQRFLPGVLAVAFSALLIALQCGLLLGMFAVTSIPVDQSSADIWIAAPHVQGVDLGRPIPLDFMSRLASQQEVEQPEVYIQGFNYWTKPRGGSQLCNVVGGRLEETSISILRVLPRELRQQLTEPGTVVIDKSDMDRLGIEKVGEMAEVTGHKVRVIGLVEGLPSFAGPYVFCSIRTARPLLHLGPDKSMFLLARCRESADAQEVVKRLRDFDDMTVFATRDFSFRTRMHWLTTTKAGIALGYTAVLGLLVGAVVTSQTLYSATVSSFREYATLEALGIPRWRIAFMIVSQAFWIGISGIVVALPVTLGLAEVARLLQVHVLLPVELLVGAAAVTLTMALLSGLAALRSLRFIDVYSLLR